MGGVMLTGSKTQFHRGEYTVAQVKEHLGQAGLLVRPFEEFEP